MVDTAIYLVPEEIARRCDCIKDRYRTQDGRYIVWNKDLAKIRLKSDEYLTGLQGIEKIEKSEAEALIRQNGYAMGAPANHEEAAATEEAPAEEAEAPAEENANEEQENE